MNICCIPLQDFALDPEESRMRSAAHHMVRFMTAGMALITCREPLLVSINTNIKQALLATLRVSYGQVLQFYVMIQSLEHAP